MAEAKATSNYKTYGVLYNWPAVMDGLATSDQVPSGVKGVCPLGWHLPSDEEWKILEKILGMAQGADATSLREYGEVGKKLKSTTGWQEGANGDNSSGFSALPGGHIFYDHNFRYIGLHAIFWTATDCADFDDSDAWFRDLSKGIGVVRDANMYFQGLSVRCLKD